MVGSFFDADPQEEAFQKRTAITSTEQVKDSPLSIRTEVGHLMTLLNEQGYTLYLCERYDDDAYYDYLPGTYKVLVAGLRKNS